MNNITSFLQPFIASDHLVCLLAACFAYSFIPLPLKQKPHKQDIEKLNKCIIIFLSFIQFGHNSCLHHHFLDCLMKYLYCSIVYLVPWLLSGENAVNFLCVFLVNCRLLHPLCWTQIQLRGLTGQANFSLLLIKFDILWNEILNRFPSHTCITAVNYLTQCHAFNQDEYT